MLDQLFTAWEPRAVWFLWALHVLLAAVVTVHTLIHKRNVAAAIGWIGLAWLAPYWGALFYLGFGVNRVKRRAALLMGSAPSSFLAATPRSGDPLASLEAAVGAITQQNLVSGKVVKVFFCGDEAYPEMLKAIEGAKSSIRLETYIFRADALGQRFIAALAGARRRGVEVSVLIDGFGGGFLLSRAYFRLRKQGVDAARFLHSMVPWKMPFMNLRLHKKILLIDGEYAFVGGLNIAAENLLATKPKDPVADHHFRVEGEMVAQIEQEFDDDWEFATERRLKPSQALREIANGPERARAIPSGPDQEVDQLVLTLLSAVNAARRSIRIATPYFLPDENLVTALELAALRGVSVDITLPAKNNHVVVAWAAQAHVGPLLKSGCRIWRRPAPFDHSKLMTVDGVWSLIGSANWDTRSLRLNFEMTVECYDPDLAGRIEAIIDERRGAALTLNELDRRPFIVKLRDAAARLTMPYI